MGLACDAKQSEPIDLPLLHLGTPPSPTANCPAEGGPDRLRLSSPPPRTLANAGTRRRNLVLPVIFAFVDTERRPASIEWRLSPGERRTLHTVSRRHLI